MRIIAIVSFLLSSCTFVGEQKVGINLSEYLKPRSDTLYYNCVYNSFHATGLHDTIRLVYRKIPIGSDTAFYISNVSDTAGISAWLASFIGSAMIFKNDSVWLASLAQDQDPNELTQKDFDHILPPRLIFTKPFELARLKWSFVMEVFIKNYQLEDISIGDTVLKRCLKLNLMVYDRSTNPDKSTVWLNRDYGIVKWIRTTGREQVLDLKRH